MSFCKYCGSKVTDGSKFCQNCGAEVEIDSAQPVSNVYDGFQASEEKVSNVSWGDESEDSGDGNTEGSTSVLVMGILALVFGTSFWLSLFGIIFGAVGLGKHRNYINSGNTENGKTKAGRIMSKIGLILSIIFMALFILWLIVIIASVFETVNLYDSFGNNISSFDF